MASSEPETSPVPEEAPPTSDTGDEGEQSSTTGDDAGPSTSAAPSPPPEDAPEGDAEGEGDSDTPTDDADGAGDEAPASSPSEPADAAVDAGGDAPATDAVSEADAEAAFGGASSAASSSGVTTSSGRCLGGITVSARRAQQRHVTEYAAALQSACVWTQDKVEVLESQRSTRGRAQDAACSLYWSSWVDYLRGACDRHRELHTFVAGMARQLDAQVASHDASREAVAFLPASARIVLRAGRKREKEFAELHKAGHDVKPGGGRLPKPTSPGEAVPSGTPDEVSTLDVALHGVAATADDAADGLAHLAWALRVGVLGAPVADAATALDKRRRHTEASRTWLGISAGGGKVGEALSPASGGGLIRLTKEYDGTATSIAEAGHGVSSTVTSINSAVDGAQAALQTALEVTMQSALQAVAASNAASGSHMPSGTQVTASTPPPAGSGSSTPGDATPPPVLPKAGKQSTGAAGIAEGPTGDVWLAALTHARCHVALLNAKRSYLRKMRTLFETMREAERSRTAILGACMQRLHTILSSAYGGLAGDVAPRAALTESVDTYQDFVKFVDARVKRSLRPRIETLLRTGTQRAGVTQQAVQPVPVRGRAAKAAAPALQVEDLNVMELMTTPPMPVLSPLLGPLVVRWGTLWRQPGGLSSYVSGWRQHTAVLTRGGYLHLFPAGVEELASHTNLASQPLPPVDPAPGGGEAAATRAQASLDAPHARFAGCPDEGDRDPQAGAGPLQPDVTMCIGQATLRGGGVESSPSKLGRAGGMSVQFLPSVHEAAFEVTIATPGMLFPTKTKYVLQAPSQNAMVDWMVDIQDVATGAAGTAALLAGPKS